ncbi:MAG TPA: hypothetical protein VGC58_00520, partial [Candidatus Paceibacterota bacterium]
MRDKFIFGFVVLSGITFFGFTFVAHGQTSTSSTSTATSSNARVQQPLRARCGVEVARRPDSTRILWKVVTKGGDQPVTISWTGTDSLSTQPDTKLTTEKDYTTPGLKTATATIFSGKE